jgi:TolB protein
MSRNLSHAGRAPLMRAPTLVIAWAAAAACAGQTRPPADDSPLADQEQPPELVSQLEIYDLESRERHVVHTAPVRFEAPNWTPDDRYLIFNQQGLIYRIPVQGGEPEVIPTGFATSNNNDHGVSPDGNWLVISHHDQARPPGQNSTIYILPISGGTPRQVTEHAPSYWHGWSPDGSTLAYVGARNGQYDIYTIPVEGGEETQLTDHPGLDDGPDYSPDGRHIYFNSVRTGLMQIWRMDADGGNPVQMHDDEYNDWFPHPSPDGRYLVWVSYLDDIDPGSHPPDRNVMLRLMDLETGKVSELARFTGGQGTINVPSWSPDGRRFAFVSYIVALPLDQVGSPRPAGVDNGCSLC